MVVVILSNDLKKSRDASEKRFLFSILIVYFFTWVTCCSLFYTAEFLLQGVLISLAYTVGQAIGMFKYRRLGLSADGWYSALLVFPATFVAAAMTLALFQVSDYQWLKSLVMVPVSLIAGHMVSMAMVFLFFRD